jgi:hypothetical protein
MRRGREAMMLWCRLWAGLLLPSRRELITTVADKVLDRPLSEIGGKGLFTKELEQALFADRAGTRCRRGCPAAGRRGGSPAATGRRRAGRRAPERGNANTRMRKLQDGECDATLLAIAGLERLGLAHPRRRDEVPTRLPGGRSTRRFARGDRKASRGSSRSIRCRRSAARACSPRNSNRRCSPTGSTSRSTR